LLLINHNATQLFSFTVWKWPLVMLIRLIKMLIKSCNFEKLI